jgi:hypothetical protein
MANSYEGEKPKRITEPTRPRPVALTPLIDRIPTELKARTQWVGWNYHHNNANNGRWTKVPICPGTG